MNTKNIRCFRLAIASILLATPLCAQVPSLINYQGRLTDAEGNPVTGTRTMAIRIYDAPTGGNMIYEEALGDVAVTEGVYSFRFGSGGTGIAAVLTGEDYLALAVNGTEEAVRTRLLAVPFALKAKESEDTQALRQQLVAAGLLFEPEMIAVEGGMLLPVTPGLSPTEIADFEIGKYEVTWSEWQETRDWAVDNGYIDLANVGAGSAWRHPVREVNWYDVLKWSNARSEKEGLVPVYEVGGEVYRIGEIAPTVNSSANGYRLPTVEEWEWAARGGVASQGYNYSGSNDVNAVAWHDANSSGAAVSLSPTGQGTWPAGEKIGNELAIHDMSGNVSEWCWNRYVRGGSWLFPAEFSMVSSPAFPFPGDDRIYDLGFRLARSLGN